jgi:hypothetical protein
LQRVRIDERTSPDVFQKTFNAKFSHVPRKDAAASYSTLTGWHQACRLSSSQREPLGRVSNLLRYRPISHSRPARLLAARAFGKVTCQ